MTDAPAETPDPITVDALSRQDAEAVRELDDYAFIVDPDRPDAEADFEGLDFDRTFGVRGDVDPLRGIYTSFDLRLAQPGPLGSLRTGAVSGLSWVSVHPDHRRRGVLTAMIGHHLRDARSNGYAWSALRASETAIYGRFGYAIASLDVQYTLKRGARLAAPEHTVAQAANVHTISLMSIDDATAARLYAVADAAASAELGAVTFPADLARRELRDIPQRRRDSEPLRTVLAQRDGRDVGYALYRRERTYTQGVRGGTVKVEQFVASDPGVALALGRRLVDMDLMTEVTMVNRGFDDPLLWWAGGPRGARPLVADALWLRPLDIGSVLRERGYAAPVDVAIHVTDTVLTENTGCYRLRVATDGTAEVTRTNDDAQVSCHAADLGAAHLGLRGWRALANGTVRATSTVALNGLDAAYCTGVAPIGGLSF